MINNCITIRFSQRLELFGEFGDCGFLKDFKISKGTVPCDPAWLSVDR